MSRPRTTSLHLALLGLLAHEPRTGYALRRVFETTPMAHYGGGQGTIYPALRALESGGLITGVRDPERPGRGARVLRATPKGRRALVRWLGAPVTPDDAVWRADELMLRFAFMDGLLSAAQQRTFVEQYLAAMSTELARLRAYARKEASQFPACARLAVQHGVVTHAAHVEWAKQAKRALSTKKTVGSKGR
jgi:DNA-binding PadR family transcriptional regulator